MSGFDVTLYSDTSCMDTNLFVEFSTFYFTSTSLSYYAVIFKMDVTITVYSYVIVICDIT